MKYTKYLAILTTLIVIIFFGSCDFGNEGNAVVDMEFTMFITDKNNNNLLDTLNSDAYNPDSIKLYRVFSDNCVELIYEKNKIHSSFFDITKISGKSMAILSLVNSTPHIHNGKEVKGNTFKDAENSTTYISWDSKDTDTIYATFYHSKSKNGKSTMDLVNEVYYNGNLVVENLEKRGLMSPAKAHIIK